MKAVTKILTGAAGVAALVGMAAPAAAQYPGYYPGYNPGANVVGQVIQSVLNPYGGQQQYRLSPQQAVSQCTAAVQGRLAQRYSAGYSPYAQQGYSPYAQQGYSPYGGYAQQGYSPYGGAYAVAQTQARVLSIRSIEHRSSTTMRVRGYATSGVQAASYGGYSGYNQYAYAQPTADLSFRCDIDSRGYIRDIDIDRR